MLYLYEKMHMNRQNDYIENTLLQMGGMNHTHSYRSLYGRIVAKRLLLQTLMGFIFQYLSIIYLVNTFPSLPMYPSLGLVFVMVYLFGNQSLWGLLLGEIVAYYLKETPPLFIFFNCLADVGCGWLGARLCQSVFSSDVMPLISMKEWVRFFKISALVSLMGSMVKTAPQLLQYKTITWNFFLYQVGIGLGFLNGVLVLFWFVVSWLSLLYSREKILFFNNMWNILGLVFFIIFCMLAMKQFELIYAIAAGAFISFFMAYYFGAAIASLLLYLVSFFYLAYFMVHQATFFSLLGSGFYFFLPLLLLVFIIVLFLIVYMESSANLSD